MQNKGQLTRFLVLVEVANAEIYPSQSFGVPTQGLGNLIDAAKPRTCTP
jgi:hypothetical protein